jgi:hypothetical protein
MKHKLLLVAEIDVEGGNPEAEARARLDAFREAVVPSQNYGITLYLATAQDVASLTSPPEPVSATRAGVVTVAQVREVLSGVEPDRGGYGSKFEYKQHERGVVVTLNAEWLPQYAHPSVLVTAVTPDHLGRYSVTYEDKDYNNNWDPSTQKTKELEEFADNLAEVY